MKAWLCFVVASLLSPLALGQEYSIRIHRPLSVGQQFRLTCEAQESNRALMTSAGKTLQDLKQDTNVEMVALVTVIEASEKGGLVKASYLIQQCTRTVGKEKKELFPRGTRIIGWLEGSEEQFTVDEKTVANDVRRALALVAGLGKEQIINDEVFGSAKPRRVGESWDIKSEAASALFDKMKMGVAKQDISGRATLEQVVQVNGVECLDIVAKIYLKKLTPPTPVTLPIKQSFGTVRLAGKYPTDPSLGPLEETIDIAAEFTAQGKAPPNTPAPAVKGSATVRRVAKMAYLGKE